MDVQVKRLNNPFVFATLLNKADLKRGVFITGTDTDVGKTWVGCHLIKHLIRQGVDVAPRKPVESGWSDDIRQTDAWKLADAANKQEQLELICPNRFIAPISPARAARLENKALPLEQLKQQCFEQLQDHQLLYVEGAGGFLSPLCEDALNADLCVALGLPVILIAEDKLGCINHVLLSVEAILQRGLTLLGIVLNTKKTSNNTLKQNNLEDLREYLDCVIISTG
ncbi:MAG: dethiobiotin synthase [Aquificaceae bacterium]|nr:MAG: dethiobiotin synthase [Aquificaceae bacterium]